MGGSGPNTLWKALLHNKIYLWCYCSNLQIVSCTSNTTFYKSNIFSLSELIMSVLLRLPRFFVDTWYVCVFPQWLIFTFISSVGLNFRWSGLAMDGGLLSLKWNNHRSTFFYVLSTVRRKVCIYIVAAYFVDYLFLLSISSEQCHTCRRFLASVYIVFYIFYRFFRGICYKERFILSPKTMWTQQSEPYIC